MDHHHGDQSIADDLDDVEVVTEELDDKSVTAMDRRDYIRAVSAVAAIGGLGSAASSSAAAETADTSLSVDERIQKHRTGDLEVVVENSDRSVVSDAEVSVTQQEHEFGFGTTVNADMLINQSSSGDNYREYIPELFNKVVIEIQTKWASGRTISS